MKPIRSQIATVCFTLLTASLTFATAATAIACTGICFSVGKKGPEVDHKLERVENTFAGRTMEFGPDVAYWKLIFVPKGYTYESCKINLVDHSYLDACVREVDPQSLLPRYESVKGYSWPVTHNYVGFTPMRYLKNKEKRIEYTLTEINDGINDAGLYCGGLYHMKFEQYSNRPSDHMLGQKNLSNMDFIAWVLGQFGTVKEVEEALQYIDVRLFDVRLFETPLEPDQAPHLHYHVVDRHGHAIVIEFADGKPKVSKSVGVITNAPLYDWQVTNLQNFVGLKPENNEQTTVMGKHYKKLSNGTGAVGLPGDFTSTSRFIRAMFMLNATVTNNKKMNTPDEAINRAFKILNQFDIPEGSVVEPKKDGKTVMEATSWTSMADLANLRYYYHTMLSRAVRMVDLNELMKMNAGRPMLLDLPLGENVSDESGNFRLPR